MSKVIRAFIGCCITTLSDWLKNLALISQPITSKTKTNCDSLAYVFPRIAIATCEVFISSVSGLFVLFVIGQCDYITLGLVLRLSSENRSTLLTA